MFGIPYVDARSADRYERILTVAIIVMDRFSIFSALSIHHFDLFTLLSLRPQPATD